jgi:signal transduction histidine kinase
MKVLIVDDAPVNLKLLRAILETEGVEVAEAVDGLQALEVLEREKVDIIISDILMPQMDGYRLCQEVRKSERWRSVPFVFHTATYTSKDDEKLCYKLGGDAYLRKPASRSQILEVLAKWGGVPGIRPVGPAGSADEVDVMKEYNARLVSKLEEKNRQLEQARAALQQANQELEWRVEQRTAELGVANEELESFCSSVSHDLRAPIRHIGGYIDVLMRDCAGKLSEADLDHLRGALRAADSMSRLIDALLELSKVTRAEIRHRTVNLSEMAEEIVAELRTGEPARTVQVTVCPDITVAGDPVLLRVMMSNLLGNAWKFTRKQAAARIEFGRTREAGGNTYFVRDNGAGFDMAYVGKLFQPFQRLHGAFEFEGTGIGLATVRRIVQRHNGSIRGESLGRQGATFYFTLGGGASEK